MGIPPGNVYKNAASASNLGLDEAIQFLNVENRETGIKPRNRGQTVGWDRVYMLDSWNRPPLQVKLTRRRRILNIKSSRRKGPNSGLTRVNG